MLQRYLTEKEVSGLIRRSVGTLRNDRVYGRGLPYIRNGRQILYDLEDVELYLESKKISHEGIQVST